MALVEKNTTVTSTTSGHNTSGALSEADPFASTKWKQRDALENVMGERPRSANPRLAPQSALSQELRLMFEKYDRDKQGTLDKNEFKKLYRSLEDYGCPPSERQIDRLFNMYSGKDGKLSFDEFAILMLRRMKW